MTNLYSISEHFPPAHCEEYLLQATRYVVFGELQLIYVVPFSTTQSNILLLDVLITFTLNTKLDLSLHL